MARYVAYFKNTKPAQGTDAVLVPGDPEARTRAERSKNGVPLPDETWSAIVGTAREVGVGEEAVAKAVGSR